MSATSTGSQRKPNSGKRSTRIAIYCAAAVHIILLVYLGLYYIQPAETNSQPIASTDHDSPTQKTRKPGLEKQLSPEESPLANIEKVETKPEQIQQQLKDSLAVAESMTDQEQQDELDRRAKWLEENSSKESINQIASTISKISGAMSRATEPADNPTGQEFDFDTAQIHEVSRKSRADGSHDYFYVMLDANGQTMDIEVPRSEGEQTYETFEKLKKSPLAMKIYRQMVMPMLDQALKSKKPVDALPLDQPVIEKTNE